MLNRPLATIPATLEQFEARFARDGFDPAVKPTEKADQLWRRRLQAAPREFAGVHAARARLRAAEDGWTVLLEAIAPLTSGKVGMSSWHPMKLAALRGFASRAPMACSRRR